MNGHSPQENFRKNAMGLLSLAEHGGRCIMGVRNIEQREKVLVSTFRGAEGLIPPDQEELLVGGWH